MELKEANFLAGVLRPRAERPKLSASIRKAIFESDTVRFALSFDQQIMVQRENVEFINVIRDVGYRVETGWQLRPACEHVIHNPMKKVTRRLCQTYYAAATRWTIEAPIKI